jgi:hypothetical protein
MRIARSRSACRPAVRASGKASCYIILRDRRAAQARKQPLPRGAQPRSINERCLPDIVAPELHFSLLCHGTISSLSMTLCSRIMAFTVWKKTRPPGSPELNSPAHSARLGPGSLASYSISVTDEIRRRCLNHLAQDLITRGSDCDDNPCPAIFERRRLEAPCR